MKHTAFRIRRFAAVLFATLAVLATAVSCEEGPVGIFASVAGETPVNANMTKAFEFATPAWVARLGTAYYAGIGVLWKRTDGGAWSRADVSDVNGSRTTFAISGAVVGANLYAAFIDTASGARLGVWTSADGSAWTRVDATFPDAATEGSLIKLLPANGQLFAVTRESTETDGVVDETHSVFYLNGATFDATAIVDADIGTPDSLAFTNGNYWFTAGSSIVYGAAPAGLSTATAMGGKPTAESFGGIIAIDGTNLLVASRSGKLWRVDTGTLAWTATEIFANSKDKAYAFSQPAYVPYAGGFAVAAGAQAYPRSSTDIAPAGGYLEFAANPFDAATAAPAVTTRLITDAINFDTSLAYKSVKGLFAFAEGAGYRLFALTDGDGLWSNFYTTATTTWSKWARE